MKVVSHSSLADLKLPVMESFYTIQGEGINSGKAAYFIRLGGCDVGCVWCDVKESWDAAAHPLKSIADLIAEASAFTSKFIVITGGEPLMYDLNELTTAFHDAGFNLAIETSGAYPLSGEWDWICVSPKKFKAPLKSVLLEADELKVVIYHSSDFEWAMSHAEQVSENCALLLQPEYSKFNKMTPEIVEYVKLHPEWRISLQTHKIIQVP
ncbi:7-carboxy-7-deazaguanine synthase QueE [soil metagenome]